MIFGVGRFLLLRQRHGFLGLENTYDKMDRLLNELLLAPPFCSISPRPCQGSIKYGRGIHTGK